MIEAIRLFRKKGVNATNHILLLLLLEEPVAMSELATAIGISTAAMTQASDKLVELKLVAVSHDLKDRRKKFIKRTARGTALVKASRSALN